MLPGGSSSRWAKFYQADLVEVRSLDDAAQALLDERVDGFINHEPTILYYLSQNDYPELTMSNLTIATELYGLAVPRERPELKYQLDLSLVEAKEQGAIQTFRDRWLNMETLSQLDD